MYIFIRIVDEDLITYIFLFANYQLLSYKNINTNLRLSLNLNSV